MQNILTLETTKYAIKLQNFEGPLDLLCHLIDKNKMDICDIKISEITDQYIEYINTMEQMNLEITSEFIFMASTLLYLKSKHLLPSGEDEEKEISEEELIRRIIEYKKYKEISKKLNEYYKENCKRFYKLPDKIELPKQKLGNENAKAVRLGNVNKETQYVLKYLGIEAPELIEDVEDNQDVILVDHNEASQTVGNISNAKILKVVDHHTMNFVAPYQDILKHIEFLC